MIRSAMQDSIPAELYVVSLVKLVLAVDIYLRLQKYRIHNSYPSIRFHC